MEDPPTFIVSAGEIKVGIAGIGAAAVMKLWPVEAGLHPAALPAQTRQ
jgi:hypothetical protein